MNRFAKSGLILFLAVLVLAGAVSAQVSRTLTGGRMGYTSNEAFTDDGLGWPLGENYMNTSMLSSFGVDVAVKMTWTEASGISHDVKIAEAANNRFTDQVNVVVPVEGAFKRVFKYPHPSKVIDRKNWQDVLSRTDPVDENIPSGAMLYHHATTWVGIDIERWTYSFMSDEMGDVVYLEWLFTNTSSEVKNDVYIGLRAEPATGSHYPGDLWGNYIGGDFASGGDSLRLYYNYDADRPGDGDRDDRANPGNLYGNFTKPQFMSYVLVHADKDVNDESNDDGAPFKGGWSQRQLSPDLNSNTHEDVYGFLSSPWDPVNPDLVLWPGSEGYIRGFPRDFDLRTIDSGTEQEKCGLFSFGPFTMQPGEDLRFVMAFVGGMLDERACIDVGYAYDWGGDALRERRPLDKRPDGTSYDFTHLGVPQNTLLEKDQKDLILDTGLDSLFATASKAIKIWENASVKTGNGSFNVDLAPPSPSLTVTSRPYSVELTWGDEAESYGQNIAGYRVYRNYVRPPSIETPTDTSFVMIADIPGTSTHSYTDENVSRGQAYYYYVTAYNGQGVESSAFLNRGSRGVQEQAASPVRPPAADWKESVVVVPNPYHVRGANKYSGSDGGKLVFLNMPAYARVHIYTMTGDLVQTLYHNEGSGDEAYLRQDTFSTMGLVSGIYLFVVEELDGPDGSATGETAIGKFIVVK
ncbi:hypothetical protein GF406_15285 [candidate division KSB1 bacterium]|nr:hypothetical protein [candidate division KSB1 bacterium]